MIFLVVWMFVSQLPQIMARPQNEIDTSSRFNLPTLPHEKDNMFMLPRKLKINEKINISIIAKKTTKMIDISLMANTLNNGTAFICSFKADFIQNTAHVVYNTSNGTNESEPIQMDYSTPDHEGSKLIFVQFKRRKPATSSNIYIIEVASVSDSRIVSFNNLISMRYLKFSGDDAKISNIQFEFV